MNFFFQKNEESRGGSDGSGPEEGAGGRHGNENCQALQGTEKGPGVSR